MTITIVPESHVDHNLTPEQLQWVKELSAPEGEIAVQTFRLPLALGTLPCGLYGPAIGDVPVDEERVYYAVRGARKGESRLLRDGIVRQTRRITVVSGPGPDGQPCVLYTSYGGPAAPREPFEDDSEESRLFWSQHALVE